MNGNQVTLSGNVVRDPELQHGKSGTAYLRFSIGRSYKTRDDQTRTSFFDFVAFGELAEHAAATLAKGMRVIVQASAEQSKWTTDDGQNRSRVEFRVEDVGPSLRWAEAAVEKAARPEAQASEPEPEQGELVGAGDSVDF